MKKKILSLILVAIMLISAMPIAVLAANDSSGTQIADQNDTRPAVKIKSADCYDDGRYDEFRALPEEDGTFYIDIYLEEGQTPADNGNVIVYYRTVDDSAVAEWGDYDGSAAMGDSFVVLNKDNGYSARVIIKSIILEEGLYTNDNKGNPNQKKIVTRRFLFELIDVTDNAKFDSRREMYCYLRAKHYTFSQDDAQIKSSFKAKYDYIGRLTKDMHEYHSWYPSMVERANKFAEEIKYFSIFYEPLSYYEPKTPEIKYKGSYSNTLDQTFSDEIRNYLQTGWCDLGLSLYGKIVRDFWDSDGEATLHLYYTYNGKRMTAVSLYLEGEFDDSEYLGWEKAFEYALEYDGQAIRKDEDAWDEIYDHMYDNFIGFTLYDNDGNVACEIKMGEDRSDGDVAKVVNQLKDALRDGHAVKYSNLFRVRDGDPWEYNSDCYSYYLRLPSNYAYADSYSFEFISDSTDEDEIRWIPWCDMDYVLIKNGQPKIVADEAGNQKITTNLDTLKIGDPLRMGIRFDKPVHVANKNNDCYILVDIYNSTGCIAKDVRLNLSQLSATNNGSYNYYAWDTLVFESEGALSDLVSNGKISSLRNIRLYDGSEAKENPSKGIRCFLTNESLYSKRISDLYGFDKDMRTPVASLAMSVPEGWSKTRSVGICVNILDNGSTRFNDYVTVYYQWSNSDKLPDPDSYTSSIVFNTAKDGEIVKYITGTGNGETFLHMKAVSSFGKSSVSVMRTDPDKDYVPYGPFLFDNTPPTLSGVSVSSDLKVRTLTVPLPDDGVGSGFKDLSLYYISKGGEERLLGKYTADSFKGDSKTLTVTVSHESVGVGVDLDGNKTLERRDIDFYWVTTDVIGNKSDKISPITLTFDTNDYLDNAIKEVGPYNVSDGIDDAEFKNTTKEIDGKTFIYDRKLNENKDIVEHPSLNKNVYYGFSFKIDKSEFGSEDIGVYTAEVYYLGEKLTDYALREESNGVYVVWFFNKMRSGRYDIKLIRTEETGVRISHTYSVYSTMGEDDSTALKKKIESGTLLNNIVYQLTTDFYYKDGNGTRKQVSYSGIKQRATFSSLSKAREYVYFRELGDIYLVQLTNEMAEALNGNGTTGYMKATGETMIPMAGQYWIRYKSEAWMPGSGDSYWVYYYYGSSSSGSLYEGSFSPNLQMALNTVSNRIANMGETVMLTDISLLGATPATSMLDKYGMPYLLDEQIYDDDEVSESTVCGNLWSMPIAFAGDLNIYKSSTYTYNAGSILEKEYPIIGNVALPEDSRFQYMTYENYSKPDSQWVPLDIKKGESFIDVLTTWGIYYIREMSADGVAVYAIFVDKDAPRITFTHTDESGTVKEIFASGSGTVNIETKNLYIGRISSSESDRFSYVAVYKASTNTLVGIYTASDLDSASVKIEDGNYKIVVADRSGNHYTVSARVSSSSLECPITESTDKHIKITCERRPDEILRYEVYLNGELLTSQYENTKTFTSAGRYTLYVQDIYGNIVSEEYVFKRSYPEVTWKYQGTDGLYHTYNYDNPPKDTDGFIMKQISDNQHKISTAVKTRFAFSDGYVYDFIGAAPSHTPSLTENAVTIEAGQSFTLKVYYKNHPDCYTLYSAVVDVTPPSISVSADVDVLKNGEYGLFQEWAKGNVGDIIEMEEIYYLLSEVGHRTVSNGAVISSDIIRINVSDANDLSSVAVYLDGELIKQQDSGFSEIIVSRWGDYKIVAKDSLGNVAEFNFTNGKPDGISYFVDGAEKETDLHGYRNFENANGKHIYTNVDYGNSEFRLDITKNADVFVSVGASGESTKVFGFRISDGKIYRLIYTIVLDKNGNEVYDASPLVDFLYRN